MTEEEIAESLDVSPETVRRDWRLARSWLQQRLSGSKMMEPDRWERIERLYHAALVRGPDEREAFLDEACAGDDDLRREVAGLLACDDPSDSFIQSAAIEIAARALAAKPLSEFQTGAQPDPPAPRRLGAYQLLDRLGRGGMGEVHLALDTRLGRKVAIKLLPIEFTADAERVRRFEQEARAASALNHPNIITIHEIGEAPIEDANRRYIVTEYVEGETLRQRMASSRLIDHDIQFVSTCFPGGRASSLRDSVTGTRAPIKFQALTAEARVRPGTTSKDDTMRLAMYKSESQLFTHRWAREVALYGRSHFPEL